MDACEVIPALSRVAGFFNQLALAARQRPLLRVKLASGEFDHHLAYGIAELTLHQHGTVVKQRDHHDRTWVDQVFAAGIAAVRQADDVLLEREELTLMHQGRCDLGLAQAGIRVRRRVCRCGDRGCGIGIGHGALSCRDSGCLPGG